MNKPVVTLSMDMPPASADSALMTYLLHAGLGGEMPIIDFAHTNYHFQFHNIALFNKHYFSIFPEQSFHLLLCNLYERFNGRFLFAYYNKHYFIAPNNGILSFIMPFEKCEWIHFFPIDNSDYVSFISSIANAARRIHMGGNISDIAAPPLGEEMLAYKFLLPTINSSAIRGYIVYIDGFGNAISNIGKEMFSTIGKGRRFTMRIGMSSTTVSSLSSHYGEVEKGQAAALFNYMGLLEAGINQGNLSRLLGVKSIYQKDTAYEAFSGSLSVHFHDENPK